MKMFSKNTIYSFHFLNRLIKTGLILPQRTSADNAQWIYRGMKRKGASKNQMLLAKTIGGIAWGWIIYNCVFNYHHLFGHYVDPDPNLWTDEYLGIPPDDEGLAPVVNPNPRSSRIPGAHPHSVYFPPALVEAHFGESAFKL